MAAALPLQPYPIRPHPTLAHRRVCFTAAGPCRTPAHLQLQLQLGARTPTPLPSPPLTPGGAAPQEGYLAYFIYTGPEVRPPLPFQPHRFPVFFLLLLLFFPVLPLPSLPFFPFLGVFFPAPCQAWRGGGARGRGTVYRVCLQPQRPAAPLTPPSSFPWRQK